MSELSIRKTAYSVEEIFHEGGPKPPCSLRRGYAMAVINNPFAGRYVEEIQWFMEDLKPLGLQMAEKLIALLGGADQNEGYGNCLLYTSPSPRDQRGSRMPSSA